MASRPKKQFDIGDTVRVKGWGQTKFTIKDTYFHAGNGSLMVTVVSDKLSVDTYAENLRRVVEDFKCQS